TGTLVELVGFVPCLNEFERIPSLQAAGGQGGGGVGQPGSTASAGWKACATDAAHRRGSAGRMSPEFGLFWAVAKEFQGCGYATEAAGAMIDFAFRELRLQRVVATTSYDNEASMAVMRKLGMRIERNPDPEPPYLQVVGILEN